MIRVLTLPILLILCTISAYSAFAQDTIAPDVHAKSILQGLKTDYTKSSSGTKSFGTTKSFDCWDELDQIEGIIQDTKRMHLMLYKGEGHRIQLVIESRQLLQRLDNYRASDDEWSGMCIAAFGFMMIDLVDFFSQYPVNY